MTGRDEKSRPDIESRLKEAGDLHRQGRSDLAAPTYRAILEEQPDHPEAVHLMGVVHLQKGETAIALELLTRATELAPDSARAVNNLGSVLMAMGQPEEAARRFQRAIELDPGFADAHYNLGRCSQTQEHYVDAAGNYRKAIELDPAHRLALNNLATLYFSAGQFEEALETYRTAARLQPDQVEPIANIVSTLERLNRVEEADELLARLASLAPDLPGVEVLRARVARREGRLDEARAMLEKVVAADPPPGVGYSAWHELSVVLDRQKDFAGAFATCLESKKIRLSLPDLQRSDFNRMPERIAAYGKWCRKPVPSPLAADSLENIGGLTFFVGFPRSGTTLMEQVLAALPGLVTTNEQTPLSHMLARAPTVLGRNLDPPDGLDDLSEEEINALRRLFLEGAIKVTGEDPQQRRLVDKLPLNIVALAIVERLFPDSNIVVALRDPRDSVLSCFMQDFDRNDSMIQFLELESSGRFYAQVMGLWLQYRDRLSVPWLEYRYEDLVGDFEGTVRHVLDFIGVGWDDSVHRYAELARTRNIKTPSYAAVSEVINTRAVGRWRNYRRELAPILPVLAPFVKEFGYEPS